MFLFFKNDTTGFFIFLFFFFPCSDLLFFSADTRGGLVVGLRGPFLLFVECLLISDQGVDD
jgi:hypothetical protein